MTVLARYVFDGQSLIYAPPTDRTWPDRYMADKLYYAESFRVGIQGTTFATRATTATTRVDPLLAPTDRRVVLISDGGTSDLLADLTSSQIITAMDSYHDARRTAGADYIAIPTVAPASTLTAGQETQRQALNAALIANPSAAGADEVVDLTGIAALQNPADTTYYYDGLHYTAVAAALVADRWRLDVA